MKIERFYDINLAHASYAILDSNEIALIDPARNPQPYYDFAEKNKAKIKAVIETHPHADFVSSHLEISKITNADIYVSKLLGASYSHISFDDGEEFKIGRLTLKAINTPGHSPDSISILLLDEEGQQVALFTGDTVFIGDVGRPDLRENAGNVTAKREALAKQMFDTVQNKFQDISEETTVYPAHGAGSLCGKNLSSDASSTMGRERAENWAFKTSNEEDFIQTLLENQPFIPKYFGFDVDMNKTGASAYKSGVEKVDIISNLSEIPSSALIVDVRNEKEFKAGHLPNSINIMLTEKGKFETWLGAIITPSEEFYILASSAEQRDNAIERAAKIGYEKYIAGAIAIAVEGEELTKTTEPADVKKFTENPDAYTILDVRNEPEVKNQPIFKNTVAIPLHELREKINQVPTDKPIMVHCAAGYRSAAGSSILENHLNNIPIYDLGDAINQFKK